jgi:hypothetical protein
MKKKILILISAVLLLTALSVLPAFAASATANVASASGNRGATITVSVSLSKATTVGSGGIELTYDKNVLELVKGEWNVSGTSLATFNTTNNKGAFAYTSGTAISGKVFTATFKVKSNAAFGDSTVKMVLQLKDGSNANISVTNNSGKVTVTCKHSYTKWSSVNGTSHTRTCSICNQPETKNHAFTNACDTSCNDCGYTRTTTHNYKTTWSSNGTQHWHECSVCKDKKDVASHIPGPAATESAPQKCTVCQYVISGVLEHICSYPDVWSSDNAGHWRVCSSCGKSSASETHVYDNNCDKDCNTCGKTRTITHTYKTEYESDEATHWHVCGVCQEPSQKVAHLYANDCDSSCDDCAHTRVTNHSFDAGVITKTPTKESSGEKTYTCSVCGTAKVVELEYYIQENTPDSEGSGTTPPQSTTPSTDSSDQVQNAINNFENGIAWWWLVIVGAAALAIGTVIGVVLKTSFKKK